MLNENKNKRMALQTKQILQNKYKPELVFLNPPKNMQRVKPSQTTLRRFAVSPRNRVLSSPKFDLKKIVPEQEQRVRNYLYKKSNLLGQGYSSKVYKAYKEGELYKPYSIKVIDLGNLSYQQRKYLQLEFKIHKGLSHPNIVKCHQTFKTTSAYYLVLQYCQHGTLSDYLKSHKKLDQTSVINILSQVIQAYIYLIGLNILHRDLKPQNVIRKDNTWKVIDFGFCCTLEEEVFQGDLNVGTPLYMPLQSLIKNLYSHKSDIYSIGIMIFKMLTGSTPWKCTTERQLIQLMKTQKISFPQTKNKYLAEFLSKSLQIDLEKRLDVQGFKDLYKKIKDEEAQIQKPYQFGNDMKKFQSNRSVTTAESVTNSEHENVSPPQTSFNSFFNSSTQTKSGTEIPQFSQNSLIIASELETCRLIHHMLLNIDSFIGSDNFQNPETGYEIHCNIKEFLVTFFYKYVLKKVRILNSYFTAQQNETIEDDIKFLGFKAWKQFRKSGQFKNLALMIKQKLKFYEAEFLESYIKKSILTIRFINKKFPELSQNNVPLGSKFYSNFLEFIKPEIGSLNTYILDNLDRAKVANKTLKKDRILAFSYWIRLYIQFLEKFKFLEVIEKENEKQNLEKIGTQLLKGQSQCLILSHQLEKLKSIKKTVKIEFLYNFKETNLEFKEFLSLRKKLTQIFEIIASKN